MENTRIPKFTLVDKLEVKTKVGRPKLKRQMIYKRTLNW